MKTPIFKISKEVGKELIKGFENLSLYSGGDVRVVKIEDKTVIGIHEDVNLLIFEDPKELGIIVKLNYNNNTSKKLMQDSEEFVFNMICSSS